VIYAVSLDPPDRNRAFAASIGGGAIVLSDEDGATSTAYGTRALGGLYAKRVTFFIDAAGIIRRVDDDVDPANHGPDVLRALGEMLSSRE
jgi:peroxiredoxin Q/BCP